MGFNNTNSISQEISPQTEIDRASARRIPNFRKNKHIFSSENSENKLQIANNVHSLRRLNHQKENLINAQSVSEPKESKVEEEHKNIFRRPRIKPGKPGEIKEAKSHSRSSVTTSVTSTSFSVTHNGEGVIQNDASKKKSIDHRNNLPPRRRGRLPSRRGKNETVANERPNSKTSKRVDIRLKSKIDPRARSRGHPFKEDSGKLNKESIITSTPTTIASIAKKTNKKVQKQFPRLSGTNLATSEHKINQELYGQNKSSEIQRLSTDLVQKENFEEKETEMNTKEGGLDDGKELPSTKTEKYSFRLESERDPPSALKDKTNQNRNTHLGENDGPIITNRKFLISKSLI